MPIQTNPVPETITRTLQGHNEEVTALAFSPDKRLLATASWDTTVRLWDTSTGEVSRELQGHTKEVRAVAFSPDGQTLASGSFDQTIRLWHLSGDGDDTPKQIKHGAPVTALAFSPIRPVLASLSTRTIRLWDSHTQAELLTLPGDAFASLIFSPDGDSLFTADEYERNLRRWDARTGEPQLLVPGCAHEGVWPVAMSGDGAAFAASFKDRRTRFWRPDGPGQANQEEQSWKRSAATLALSNDGDLLAIASSRGRVLVGQTDTGAETEMEAQHEDYIALLAFSPNAGVLVSASWAQQIMLWDVATGGLLHQLQGEGSMSIEAEPEAMAVAFRTEREVLIAAVDGNEVALWSVMLPGSQMLGIEGSYR